MVRDGFSGMTLSNDTVDELERIMVQEKLESRPETIRFLMNMYRKGEVQ